VRSIITGICRAIGLSSLALLLLSCGGGGGGSSEGGFTGTADLNISITLSKTLLPVNSFLAPPQVGGIFTSTFTVKVERADGSLFPAESIAVDLLSPDDTGALAFLNGDEANQDDDGNELLFRRLVFEETTGIATGHFHALSNPGTAILEASATDPDTGVVVSARAQVTVGSGASTGQPSLIGFQFDPGPLYITGQGQIDVKLMNIFILDDAGIEVPNPTANNVRLELLPGRPNGGEILTAVGVDGNQDGAIVNTSTINGVAQATLQSGTLPGTVRIAATTDRADNNVDNGIQSAVTDVVSIPISSGEIVSLTFTGPYPGAVAQRANNLGLGAADAINSGVYFRDITVIATDEFGNPPPPGQPITFRLIDSPASGYPDEGRGVFTIAGDDGNPEEGGLTFTTQTSSLAGASVGCELFFGGIPTEFVDSPAISRREFRPNQEGSRIVTGVSGASLLSVNTAFNPNPDTGFDVPYIVGCAPHAGNVENDPGGVNVLTDGSGVASTVMNYAATQLGRNFCLAAEANGGKAGSVLCHWYLGIADGSTLTLIPEDDAQLTATSGETLTQKLTLQLLDGGGNPLPAERIAVQIVITDPDATDVVLAEIEVAAAEARLAAAQEILDDFIDESGVNLTPVVVPEGNENFVDPLTCFIQIRSEDEEGNVTLGPVQPNPNASPDCAIVAELETNVAAAQTALNEAITALAEAQARDDFFTPIATVEPENLLTGPDGIVMPIITVEDLPPNGLVEFFFSTVGPEIRSDTITVTVTPATGDDG